MTIHRQFLTVSLLVFLFVSCTSTSGKVLTSENKTVSENTNELKLIECPRINAKSKPNPLPINLEKRPDQRISKMFGRLTGFDDMETPTTENFFCLHKFQEAVLNDSCLETFADDSFPDLKPVISGDFDGDGLLDSLAQLVLKESGNKVIELVWFNGEKHPRFLTDFIIIEAEHGKKYDDSNIEDEFKKKSYFLAPRDPNQLPYRDSGYSSLFKSSRPQSLVRGNLNEFKLTRSLVYESAGDNKKNRIIVFSKNRDKIIQAVSEDE